MVNKFVENLIKTAEKELR